MADSTPNTYDYGGGMEALNRATGRLRSRHEGGDPTEPTRTWLDEDLTPEGLRSSLTIILDTGGCRWARAGGCTMCGYVSESENAEGVSHEALMSQIEGAIAYEAEHAESPAEMVKLYSSGSILDDREVGEASRQGIADRFGERERIVIESLPDFVTEARLEPFVKAGLSTDVAIGVETATDRVRRDAVNKYFDFDAVEEAAATAHAAGAGVKAYLLLKPPFLTESEAIEDTVHSVERLAPLAHTISVNPTTVMEDTLVEELYYDGGYRPPWLWSVADVLERTADAEAIVVSDPVGAGSDRGPHNCGECDETVERAIGDFNRRQDPTVFDEVSCDCELTWETVLERETGYNMPLGM
ncbi:MAG: archaeosine biosynthesis radical SAM protein RaSEA [Halodesulfurarchaeum sp.]|nr:archaeosine biosynthesis radical SAM protein RaSEA [Halodesulfurarchaeum sp.]